MKKGTRSEIDPQKLALQLDRLSEMNPTELREQWQILFGADPPPKLRSSLLVRRLLIGFRRKPLGASNLQLSVCSSESPTMPPHDDGFPRLPRRFT
jgi:hypothetical protein